MLGFGRVTVCVMEGLPDEDARAFKGSSRAEITGASVGATSNLELRAMMFTADEAIRIRLQSS
jgi:hypothetical protein